MQLTISEFFNNQLLNVWSQKDGEISIELAKKHLQLVFSNNNGELRQNSILGFEVQILPILCLTDPVMLVDALAGLDGVYQRNNLPPPEKPNFAELLFRAPRNGSSQRALNFELLQKRLGTMKSKICEASGGLLKYDGRKFWFHEKHGSEERKRSYLNLSSDLKTLALMQLLIDRDVVKEKIILIFDEPETHLHPEWKISLAEFLVVLQKEYGLHMLLSSHSPYFIRAIEVYSKKYGIIEDARFYFPRVESDGAVFQDVSRKTSEICDSLARPLQEIDNVYWQN